MIAGRGPGKIANDESLERDEGGCSNPVFVSPENRETVFVSPDFMLLSSLTCREVSDIGYDIKYKTPISCSYDIGYDTTKKNIQMNKNAQKIIGNQTATCRVTRGCIYPSATVAVRILRNII